MLLKIPSVTSKSILTKKKVINELNLKKINHFNHLPIFGAFPECSGELLRLPSFNELSDILRHEVEKRSNKSFRSLRALKLKL